jgi:hypothetical protein
MGGTAASVATKSQMRPFEQIFKLVNLEYDNQREPHLLPEDAPPGEHTVCFKVHAEQADDHNDK